MYGAIIGDMIGSRFERGNWKGKGFELFNEESCLTDDTVMTIAVADWLLHKENLADTLRKWGRKYPLAGYGGTFKLWVAGVKQGPYNSWGNGSAMRVSPVGWAAESLEECIELATATAEVTHNHPEGLKGAQAIAAAIFLARTGATKKEIKDWISVKMDYNLNRSLEDIRPDYTFDVSCQGSVPESIIAFLESEDLEDAVRNAVSLGGDTDTMACMAASISEVYYHRNSALAPELLAEMNKRLPEEMKTIIADFYQEYGG